MSPGPVRRAARRSEMQIMFAVREGSRSLLGRAGIDLHRTSARPLGPPRPAQRTASTLMPRALSDNGCVDPVAGATRALSRA
eukprot:scaffold29107_cov61-Phaeocystis_antarctica.AAC.3